MFDKLGVFVDALYVPLYPLSNGIFIFLASLLPLLIATKLLSVSKVSNSVSSLINFPSLKSDNNAIACSCVNGIFINF